MKKNDKNSDNWSALLTDLGLEQEQNGSDAPKRHEEEKIEVTESRVAEPRKTKEPKNEIRPTSVTESDGFGAGILAEAPPRNKERETEKRETPVEAKPEEEKSEKPRSGKKRFFERFPKMNLFGSPKESLESVVEGAKAPSLGGKSFTSNTLEKVPHATGRHARKEETASVKQEPEPEKPAIETKNDVTDTDNPWSNIAAQVGALSAPKEPEPKSAESAGNARRKNEEPRRDRQQDRQRGRRNIPSLFEEPKPEPEEAAALQGMMKSGDLPDRDAEQRLHSMFVVEKPAGAEEPTLELTEGPPRHRERSRRDRDNHDRSHRNRDNRNSATETVDDVIREAEEVRKPVRDERPRGRRGSRYTEQESVRRTDDDSRYADESSRKSAWNSDTEPPVPQRSSRRSRREESREEREERKEPATRSAEPSSASQKSIPSWDDAINMLVDANIARHGQRPPRKNGGRR